MNINEERLRTKLALWDTPGFSQFLNDLDDAIGSLVDIKKQAEIQRILYKGKLQDLLEKDSKFKQTKLDI